ncbi:MAG: rpfG 1 [Verrucomicrobiales bacterium]|nr:rpfG 1 [Verrucomicrobiales bacterium]
MNLHPNPKMQNILIVDDEEIVLVALRDTLLREGYQVVTSTNAVQALSLLKEQGFAVIITDQQMPLLTGLEFLAQVKLIQPDATRILITAVLSLSTVIDAINKGEIYRFIVKPWLREELLATVKNAVQRYELICKNIVLQATTLSMNDQLQKVNKELEQQVAMVAEKNNALQELNETLRQNLQKSVELCVKTLETFYPTLGSQARRVYELCRAMSGNLNLSDAEQQALEISGWLYDIGLIGVPRHVIRKWELEPHTLTEQEVMLIEQHPAAGEKLVGFIHTLGLVGPTIRGHHENFDGSGYPDKIAGEYIPWTARLLAVAVAFAESKHDPNDTLEIIKRQSGVVYDPEAVRALLRSLPKANMPKRLREVLMAELRPGMVLAKEIYTSNGILLVPDGLKLNETYIDKLRNHNKISPIAQSLLVYC